MLVVDIVGCSCSHIVHITVKQIYTSVVLLLAVGHYCHDAHVVGKLAALRVIQSEIGGVFYLTYNRRTRVIECGVGLRVQLVTLSWLHRL